VSSSDDSSSSSSSDSESEVEKKSKRSKKRTTHRKKSKVVESSSSSSDSDSSEEEATSNTTDASATATAASSEATSDAAANIEAQLKATQAALANLQLQQQQLYSTSKTTKTESKKVAVLKALDFKRVDQVWDSKARDWKYTESVEETKDEFDGVFTVRRRFGWDNKYIETQVDIKSKQLRNVLQVIFKDCKSISLVEDKPSVSFPRLLTTITTPRTQN
jgi:hypothetical protein